MEESGHKPANKRSLEGIVNHPAVYVNWDDALVYCEWLTKRWTGYLPQGYKVTLPSEAEWEKGARGGEVVPEQAMIESIQGLQDWSGEIELRDNPLVKREYPWGAEVDQNKANYDETGIGSSSAVGCFRAGVSEYGCEEMSGNVWEWTRSIYQNYPYLIGDGREDLKTRTNVHRVLRGGAFLNFEANLRCAARYRNDPNSWYNYYGFRVMVSPLL